MVEKRRMERRTMEATETGPWAAGECSRVGQLKFGNFQRDRRSQGLDKSHLPF